MAYPNRSCDSHLIPTNEIILQIQFDNLSVNLDSK